MILNSFFLIHTVDIQHRDIHFRLCICKLGHNTLDSSIENSDCNLHFPEVYHSNYYLACYSIEILHISLLKEKHKRKLV